MAEPTNALIWISGASSGIGQALARTVPWDGARIIDISRRRAEALEHLEADLADPGSWDAVASSFEKELAGFDGGVAVFVHAAGTIEPMGFVAEVDPAAYRRNVLLNSAAPQVLGQAFVAAAADKPGRRDMVVLTSGAAKSVYPGWASYGAAKAAVDQWVRDVGAEQERRGGVRVVAVAPGTVDTGMQALIRETPEDSFPQRQKFVDLHAQGKLTGPAEVAQKVWALLDTDVENGAVVDLRELAPK
ncbi:MAG: SDR family NAD(P)-dependent oxidoreductase [Acidimicrobiales bacterium]